MAGDASQTTLREDIEASFTDEEEENQEEEQQAAVEVETESEASNDAEEETETEEETAESEEENLEEEASDETEQSEEQEETEEEDDIPPPAALKGEIKENWKEVPRHLKEEFVRLEQTQAKGMQKVAENARFGEELKQELAPYEPMIRAEGGTPATAIRSLLNTAYQLRTAAPAQKAQLIQQLAQQYDVDMNLATQEQPQVDPNVAYALNRINQFEQQQQRQQTQQQQETYQKISSEIEQFAQDHPYFNEVRETMAGLIDAGIASDLEDAYDKACYADPEIRQKTLSKLDQEREAERKKAEQEKVKAKKKAAGSVNGSVSKSSSDNLPDDLRSAIAAQVYGDAERI